MENFLWGVIVLDMMTPKADDIMCSRDRLDLCSREELVELQREDANDFSPDCRPTGKVRWTGALEYKCGPYYVYKQPGKETK